MRLLFIISLGLMMLAPQAFAKVNVFACEPECGCTLAYSALNNPPANGNLTLAPQAFILGK